MKDLDLNIDNYNLKDILKLFSISENFTEKDMREAKRIVLQTHPDKSRLDPKYFHFFSKAYKIIYGIYQFRQTNAKDHSKYTTLDNKNEYIIKNALESETVKKDFNKWFNELFEKTKLEDEFTSSGYDKWLKSDEGIEDFSGLTREEQEKKLEEKKNKIQALTKYKDVEEIQNNGYNILRERPDSYSSDIFSSLAFEDIKSAHQEGIIPITSNDLNSIEHKSVSKLKEERDQKLILPSMQQAKELLAINNSKDNKNNAERAFRLMREDELVRQRNEESLRIMRQLR
jgi:hypothetical protein